MLARQTIAPTREPITIDDVLSWGHLDGAENPAMLGLAIAQAREEAEHTTGRRLLTQTWEIDVTAGDVVNLYGLTPVQSIKQAGIDVPWTNGLPPTCTAPADGVLTIVCGWADVLAVPAGIRMWMVHRVITSAEARQFLLATQQISQAPRQFADGLLDPYRIPLA
jgi:hypothetical protein